MEEEEQPKLGQEASNGSAPFFRMFCEADKMDFLLMILGSVGACIHGAALPVFLIFSGQIIDSLGSLSLDDSRNMISEVSKNASYMVYLGIADLVSSWIGIASWMQTAERQTARLRVKYLESVLRQDIGFFDTESNEKDLTFHISSDAILVQDTIGHKIGQALRCLSQSTAGFAIALFSVWQLTLVTLAAVLLIAIAGLAYSMIMSTLSRKCEAANAQAGSVADEVLSQVRTVYSLVGEIRANSAYSRSATEALKYGKKSGLVKGLGIGITYGLLFCAWAMLLWYASVLIRHHNTTAGKAFTSIISVIFSCFALGQAVPIIAAVGKARTAIANIISMIGPSAKSSETLDNGITLSNLKGEIEFSHVGFSYPSRPDSIFEDLNFSIEAGKTYAIVGPSGSGKSTIVSLIQRFYDPTSGTIMLDGHNIKNLQLRWLRQQIGLVSQEPVLFATTISRNILYGREDADVDQVIEASQAANAHTFIESFPDGYYTQVGEGGIQLSAGQKRRIAIARAILRNPRILLLDEIDCALDSESELAIQKALNKVMSNRTTIVVARTLYTVFGADGINFLKNGQVAETGNHLELMAQNGEYAALVRSQAAEASSYQSLENIDRPSEICTFAELIESEKLQDELLAKSKREQLQPSDPSLVPLSSVSAPSFSELAKLIAPDWPCAILGSVGAILAGVEASVFAVGISNGLTAFYSPDESRIKEEIRQICFIFVGVAVISIPIYILQHYFSTLMGERLRARIRLFMFSDTTLVRSAIADRLSVIMQNLALTMTALVIAFSLSWRIAAVLIATFPLLIGASIAEQLFRKGFGGDYNQAYSRPNSVAREAITNIRTVAAFGLEDLVSIRFSSELYEPNKQACLKGYLSGLGYGMSQFFAFCSYALALWYASVLMKHGESSFGDTMKSFMLLFITALAIADTFVLIPDIVQGLKTMNSVFDIVKRETAINPDDPSAAPVTDIKGDVEFRNVGFHYPSRPEVTIFRLLNLRVEAGKSLAVVGRTGCGKSTIIQLMMRFYDPTTGAVLVDGMDIRGLNLRSFRQKIGLVQEEPVLFSTTVYENIRYGNEEASEAEIVKAAKAANAHEFISTMPEGYQTEVGDRGMLLSRGQKQRVAIARALLRDPSILLLEETTEVSDSASEKLIQEALDRLTVGRTTIMVARKLSTAQDADCIAVLQHGYAVEMGSHAALSAKPSSLYAQLMNLQQTIETGGRHRKRTISNVHKTMS